MIKLLLLFCLIFISSCGKPKTNKDIPENLYYSISSNGFTCESCVLVEFRARTLTITIGNIPLAGDPALQGCEGFSSYRSVDFNNIELPQSVNELIQYNLTNSDLPVEGQCFANTDLVSIRKRNATEFEFNFNNNTYSTIIKKRGN
jgi:hypothetical protein